MGTWWGSCMCHNHEQSIAESFSQLRGDPVRSLRQGTDLAMIGDTNKTLLVSSSSPLKRTPTQAKHHKRHAPRFRDQSSLSANGDLDQKLPEIGSSCHGFVRMTAGAESVPYADVLAKPWRRERLKVSKACQGCRLSKSKCDGGRPGSRAANLYVPCSAS